MIGPVVPGWVFLLFVLLAGFAAFAVLAVVVRFVLGVIKLVFRDDDARWRETSALGAVILLAVGGYWIANSERRSAENQLDSIVELSVLDVDVAGRSVSTDRPCGGSVAKGPGLLGNEDMIVRAITEDADSFENDGWTVQRLINSSDRRATLYLRLAPRAFVARKGQLLVTATIENDRYVYRVHEGDCPEPETVGPRFVEEVERLPPVPDQDAAPDPIQIIGLVERNGAGHVRQADISEPLIQGLGIDIDCFVASGTWSVYGAAERRDVLSSIAAELERDGWTVQREDQLQVSPQPDVRFVARRADQVVDGSTNRDGVTLTEFPDGCATIGPYPQPLQHFVIVEQFTQLPD